MESRFYGTAIGLFLVNLLVALISMVTLGIGTPWALCIKYNWITDNTTIDGRQLYFDGTGAGLWGNWIKWFLLTIITFGIYSFWLVVRLKEWEVKHTHMR